MSLRQYIYKATENYVEALKQYDISQIVREFVNKYYSGQIYVFDYIGWLPFGRDTPSEKIKKMKIWKKRNLLRTWVKPNLRYRYNIGILNVSHGYKEEMTVEQARDELIFHYLAFILDNEKKEVWILDSLAQDPIVEDSTGFVNVIRTIYPNYTIRSMQICSGCGRYEPYQDNDLWEQNIFCHTWTLYFLYSIIKSISLGYEIDVAIDYLSNNCMRPAENLLLIKSFAKYVYDNFLAEDKPLEMEFSLIFLPKFIQDNELKAYDLMEIPDWDDIETD